MKKYKIIYADPPWKYNDEFGTANPSKYYDTMDLEAIKSLPISNIANDDCFLFLWGTWPMLKEMLEVMEAWGFEYKTLAFNWIKETKTRNKLFFGCGKYTRANSEGCFLGIKGKPVVLSHAVRQPIIYPNLRHSQKPNHIRDRIIELCGDLPRIELFARQKVEGWDVWGNEVDCSIELNKK